MTKSEHIIMYILLQQQKSISTDWDQPLSAEDWVRERV